MFRVAHMFQFTSAFLATSTLGLCLALASSNCFAQGYGGGGYGYGGGGSGGGGTGSTGGSPIRTSDPSFGQGGTAGGACPENDDPFGDLPIPCVDDAGDGDDVGPGVYGPGSPPGATDADCLCQDCGATTGGDNLARGGAGGSGSGCTTCSGGGPMPSASLPGDSSASDFGRIWIPNNQVNNGSFSPGYYSNFDSQLDIFPETGGTAIGFFDVIAKTNYLFVDGLDGDTQDGVFHDLRNNHAQKLELLTGSGSVTSSVSSAVTAKVTHWNGATETFEIFDLDSDPSEEQYAARLTKRTDRLGRDLTISYKSWTASQISSAPDRQWQINTVSDVQGHTLTFTYASAQQGGRWSVSKIARNDGADVDFVYTSDKLSQVTFHDGSTATYTYGQDTAAQTATVTLRDSSTAKRPITYHLTNDYMTLTESEQAAVINQPVGVYRMAEDDSENVLYQMIPNSDPSIDTKFVFRGGNLASVIGGDGTKEKYATWSYSAGGGGGGPGTITQDYTGIDGTLDGQQFGAASSTTTAQLYNGQWPGSTNSTGRQRTYQYDSDGNVTKITFTADSTYEEYAYNSQGQVTRKRSREGDVTKYTYASNGNMTKREAGLQNTGGSDTPTSSYADWNYEYYPSGHANAGLLKTEKDPLYTSGNMHRTDYEYNTGGLTTKKTGPADTSSGNRPVTTYAYNSSGQLSSVTDPEGRITSYTYDSAGRQTQVTYPDTSTEQTLYATSGSNMGRVIKTKDRVGTVTTYAYNSDGQLNQTLVGAAIDANILDGNADDTVITDPNLQNKTEFTYLAGSTLKTLVKQNGAQTIYVYDAKNRISQVKQVPRFGTMLISKKGYKDNELLYDEDPYGRRKYYGYRASDGTLIRTVTCTTPSYTLANFAAVWNLTRSSAANASYIVHDAIRDDDGNLTQIVDGRNIETRYEYDAQGRETKKTEAWGTSLASITETVYDDAGNVTEVRSPRYFDSSDTEGHNKAKETWTYNGRNLVATHTVAPGTSIAASESYTYDEGGHQKTHTDFRGKVWETIDDTCCGKSTASKNPLGHGSVRNTDPAGRVVHTASVSDVSSHVANMLSPIDAKTLSESTTKYDALGRTIASTTWLVKRGAINELNPPIAGLGGVSAADGLTTQYLYDNNLTDGVGLDSSAGVTPALGGSAVKLSTALTKLSSSVASGGAGISFNASSPARASVVINPEGEVSFSISDAAGRGVMSGQLDSSNALLSWSCQLHDTVTSVSGFGNCLETQSIDALGKVTKSLTDGAGRTLRSIDQLGKVTTFTYDAGGNQLSVRDPNSVGQDVVYDALGRAGLTTDTAGDTTNSTYDRAGNRIAAIDGKSKSTTYVYDARGRQKSQKDRINGTTSFTYLATGQLASLTDAESQTTSYTYDDAGQKLTEQYPDHTGGSPGSSTYGIVTFTNDAAGRVLRKQDQLGDTVTHNYDLAGRLTKRDYRTRVNSPSGTIADSDTFTYDDVGRMLSAVSGRYTNTVGYAYDNAGRKSSESLTISGKTYTTATSYNAKGQLTGYTYPDGTSVQRTFTDRGELYQLKHAGTTVDTRTYDNGGRMTGSSYNNGVSESRSYGSDNTLSSISYSGASIGNLSYSWDDNKNKTAETISGTMSNYGFSIPTSGYDSEDRLVTFNRTSGLNQSWSLSAVGDWNSQTTNGTSQARTHGPTHELTAVAGNAVTTDVKGNMSLIPSAARTGGSSLALAWDMDNRLKSADVGGNGIDVTYQFDALGRRVARTASGTTTVYVQSGQQTIADYTAGANSSSPMYRYVYGSYIDEPVLRYQPTGAQSVYYHRNQQYSVTALTNASGGILERYAYTAYGTPTITNTSGTVLTSSAHNNRYTYTGREWDETISLYHYRARMYDPALGSFCGRDPIGFTANDSSIYRYVFSNPLFLGDPLGLCKLTGTESMGAWRTDSNGKLVEYAPLDGSSYPKATLNGWKWFSATLISSVRVSKNLFKVFASHGASISNHGTSLFSKYYLMEALSSASAETKYWCDKKCHIQSSGNAKDIDNKQRSFGALTVKAASAVSITELRLSHSQLRVNVQTMGGVQGHATFSTGASPFGISIRFTAGGGGQSDGGMQKSFLYGCACEDGQALSGANSGTEDEADAPGQIDPWGGDNR